jgi:hypothetical protein
METVDENAHNQQFFENDGEEEQIYNENDIQD